MRTPQGLTPSGFETQFGTNYLGHFLLFQLLLPTLLSSSTPSFQSRVISVSSLGHRHHPPTPSNWNLTDCYDTSQAYSNSKIANIWFASEVERRHGQHGVHALSVHPGGVFTGLAVHMSEEELQGWKKYPVVMAYMKNAEQGAATEVWAAVAKCWEGKGGVYLEDCQVSAPVQKGYGPVDSGFEKWAYDESGERELWERSLEWVDVGEE